MTAQDIIDLLGLEPHLDEGGYFTQSYRSSDVLPATALPERYTGPRYLGTAIYYLLMPGTCSQIHRLPTDEIFHFYLGDPVNILLLFPDGTSDVFTLGPDIQNGQTVQLLVPRGCWQGALLADGGSFALMGTTMCPGFDYDDYEAGSRNTLIAEHPERKELIENLTE